MSSPSPRPSTSRVSLEDLDALRAADPSDMLGAIGHLPEDAKSGYALGLSATDVQADKVSSIVFLGMGGSAVAGDVARVLFAPRLSVPIEVHRSPVLPEFAQQHALVIATSFSGDTAETLAAFEEAVRRGCRIIAITSGGQLARRAAQEHVPVVTVPGGGQPRAALGTLAFTTLGVLEAIGEAPSMARDVTEAISVMRAMVAELGPEHPGNSAKALAEQIGDRVPVVWAVDGIASVAAMRFKCQLNENGKVPAFWSAMSELDHNEIVGWDGDVGERFFLVSLRHNGEDPAIAARFPLSVDLVAPSGLEHAAVKARGESPLAQLCSLVVFGDYVSAYVGLRRGVDPTPVDVIMSLKRDLA